MNCSIIELIESIRAKGRELRVVVHNGVFHIDETLCLAMLKFLCLTFEIEMRVRRTRDQSVIERADIAIDVGMVYDPEQFRFDHHQKGGAGRRVKDSEESTSYSACGLFWKHFGHEFTTAVLNQYCNVRIDKRGVDRIFKRVDLKLIEGVCAIDNGEVTLKSNGLSIPILTSVFSSLNPVTIGQQNQEEMQMGSIPFLMNVLIGYVLREADSYYHTPAAIKAIEKCQQSEDVRILILENSSQVWRGLVARHPSILVVVQPQPDDESTWGAITTIGKDNCFEFPEEWRGLKTHELMKVTQVGEAIFCHDKGFYAGAKTKEAAIQLAQLGLTHWQEKFNVATAA